MESNDKKKEKEVDDFAFMVNYSKDDEDDVNPDETKESAVTPAKIEWILDSGCRKHLAGNPSLIGENAEDAGTRLVFADGTRSKSLRKGSVEMVLQVYNIVRHVTFNEVEYAPGFKRNLLSYVQLEKKGVRLQYEGDKRYLCNKQGTKFAEVLTRCDVMMVHGELNGALANAALVYSVVANQEHVTNAVHADTL
jgi:hypothetical protein